MSNTFILFPRGARRHTGVARPGPLAALWRDVVASWQRAGAAGRPQAVDDETLRDLGISRSELGSFQAETDGLVAATRLRVIRARGVSGF
jgi:uncharacterized protein YjiS (DUF1127 family)